MVNVSSWTLQYLVVVLLALFAGPLLSKLPAVQSLPVTLFGLDASQTIHLVVEETSLIILCILSIRTYQQMPSNGTSISFVRQLVVPTTILFVLIMTDKTLRAVGLPLIDQIGSTHYILAYTAFLLLTGIWITVAWLWNFDALHHFLSSSPQPRSFEESDPGSDDDHDTSGRAQSSFLIPHTQRDHPSTLGRYKVLKELGRGSMGIVYLGKDPTLHRFVAIKTMRLDQIDEADKLQEVKNRFFMEAESTGRLSHPNIVTVYDAGEEHDLGYIAMELLQGTTFKEWSRKPNLLPFDKVIMILSTVAEAMDYAHQQGVVHRDIKPANIILTKDHVVKVMDFGIAKMASSSKTQTDIVLGTPTYMSPEQIAGKKVDGRSDIFSLGVVMFELLTGCPPFTADNVSALLFAITHTPHPGLTRLRPDLPPHTQEVLDCALHKDPVLRYRLAGDFAQDLRSCVQGLAA